MVAMGMGPIVVIAQQAAPAKETPAVMPAAPKDLMLLAAKSNGLTGSDMQPWHLKATYTLYDDKGNTSDQGTYEELWAGPTKYKQIFAGLAFTQTDYGTEKGIFRSGVRQLPSNLIADIRRELIAPLPDPPAIEHEVFDLQPRDSNGAKLLCTGVKNPSGGGNPVETGLTYCLSADKPILRVAAYVREDMQALHNRILSFHGHFIAGDLQFVRSGKVALSAHLDSIELLNPVDDAVFIPAPDATPLPRRITISGGVAQGMLLKHVSPEYPLDAKLSGVQGIVVLQAMIGLDGRIKDLTVISGPPMLRQAALAAVQTWLYRPYLLNGEKVEVNTTINVVFSLGK
jgi:TonB family protein